MGICSAAIAKAADQSQDAIGVLDETESQLLEVSQGGLNQGLQPIEIIVRDSFGSIDNLYKQSREVTGLATGFTDFDRMTSGLQKGELIIIAARPSMGKTALAINIARECRPSPRFRCGHLQPGNEPRIPPAPHVGLAGVASISKRCKRASFGREEQERLQSALSQLVESRIFIDDSAGATVVRNARQGAPPQAELPVAST